MRSSRTLKRLALLVSFGALSLAASASPARGAVTIGQVAPSPAASCMADTDRVLPTVTSGDSYVVPATGGVTAWTLTSWSHNAAAGVGQQLTMKMFRKVGEPNRYQVVGHDGPRPLVESTLNTFLTRIQVKAGDILGNNGKSPAQSACVFSSPGDTYYFHLPGLADGGSDDFSSFPNFRLNVTAVLEPTNAFTLGPLTRNKRKGTATLTATVPNPGELTGSGKGVKVARAAVTSKTVGAPGDVKLTIRARGKKKATLNEAGKVKVKPKITYTPTGGDPNTQSVKVKLKKKL